MVFGLKIADICVALVVTAVIVFSVVLTLKKRKKGGCSCGCGSCSAPCKKESE